MIAVIRNAAVSVRSYLSDFNVVFGNLVNQRNQKFGLSGNSIATHSSVLFAMAAGGGIGLPFTLAVLLSYVAIITDRDDELTAAGALVAALCSFLLPGYLVVRLVTWLASVDKSTLVHLYLCFNKRFALATSASSIAIMSAAFSNVPNLG